MLFTKPVIADSVPASFWTPLETHMLQALHTFKEHEKDIDKALYVDDYLRVLISFVIRGTGSDKFWDASVEFCMAHLPVFNGPMCDNLSFVVLRTGNEGDKEKRWSAVLDHITKKGFLKKGEMNDLSLLMAVASVPFDHEGIWQEFESLFLTNVNERSMKPPPDILAYYAYGFGKRGKGGEEFWKAIFDHAENAEELPLSAAANVLYALTMSPEKEKRAKLAEKVEQRILAKRPDDAAAIDSDGIILLLISLSSLNATNKAVFEQLISLIEEALPTYHHSEIDRVVVTLSKMGMGTEPLWKKVEQYLTTHGDKFELGAVLNMCLAVAIEEISNP